MPGSTAMRQSTSHHAGVELAQSPPAILPGLNLIGFGMRLNHGWLFARSLSSRVWPRSASIRPKAERIALVPSSLSETCTGLPRMRRRNHITPTVPRRMLGPVGSGMRQASAR